MGAEQFMASATRRHSVFNGRWGHGRTLEEDRTCVDVDSNNRKHPSNELKQQHHLLATIGTTPQGNTLYLILRGDTYGKDMDSIGKLNTLLIQCTVNRNNHKVQVYFTCKSPHLLWD